MVDRLKSVLKSVRLWITNANAPASSGFLNDRQLNKGKESLAHWLVGLIPSHEVETPHVVFMAVLDKALNVQLA